MSSSKIINASHIQAFLKSSKNFDKVMEKVNILVLEKGKCSAELKVEEEHTNPLGGLHGGFSATLVDCISTFALMSHDKGQVPNVSVDMHLTYCKGAKKGDEVIIDANTIRCGRNLAFLEVLIKSKASGEILVKGAHTKFLMNK